MTVYGEVRKYPTRKSRAARDLFALMKSLHNTIRNVAATLTLAGAVIGTISLAQTPKSPPPDAVQSAQTTRSVADKRPEQKLSAHDQSAAFKAANAAPSSVVFKTQPDDGEVRGFDFYRDPLNAKKPMQAPEEITAQDKAMKPKVMEAQRSLLEKRYNLIPKLDPEAKMSRGKPLPVGPTARLGGMTSEKVANMTPEQIKKDGVSPYPPLPHPKQSTGCQVFPAMRIEMFPRLQRF